MTSQGSAGYRFVVPPNWPPPIPGWTPPPDWQPDPAWGPAPLDWQFWQPIAPTSGTPGAPGQPAAPGYQPPVSGYAIATLISGIVGSVLFVAIFGVMARKQIRSGARRGNGLVAIGAVLCLLWVVGIVVAVVLAIAYLPDREGDGTVSSGGWSSVLDLRAGDCAKLPDTVVGDLLNRVEVVPCSDPHNAQMVTRVAVAAASPDDLTGQQDALDRCGEQAADFLAPEHLERSLEVTLFLPDDREWTRGDHEARCFVVDPAGDFVGDLRP